MPLDHIKNFIAVSDRLGTAGQPLEDELDDIIDEGYEVVINISTNDSPDCPPDEAGYFEIRDIPYHHIPVVWTEPTLENFNAFVDLMDGLSEKKVFLHCAANIRVSAFTALYGQLRWGWTTERADSHFTALWEPNETWLEFVQRVRKNRDL